MKKLGVLSEQSEKKFLHFCVLKNCLHYCSMNLRGRNTALRDFAGDELDIQRGENRIREVAQPIT